MILSFTGTKSGMTEAQSIAVAKLFRDLGLTELHHGCCMGADRQAHDIAKRIGARVIGHLPTDDKWADVPEDLDERRARRPYLVRNHCLVNEGVGGLVAAPRDAVDRAGQRGQGTWTTAGYARAEGRRIWLALPSGLVLEEPGRPGGLFG